MEELLARAPTPAARGRWQRAHSSANHRPCLRLHPSRLKYPAGNGMKACAPGDSSPAGTIADGYKKIRGSYSVRQRMPMGGSITNSRKGLTFMKTLTCLLSVARGRFRCWLRLQRRQRRPRRPTAAPAEVTIPKGAVEQSGWKLPLHRRTRQKMALSQNSFRRLEGRRQAGCPRPRQRRWKISSPLPRTPATPCILKSQAPSAPSKWDKKKS